LDGSITPVTDATLTVYFDYTCNYSYRALHWLDAVLAARPDLHIHWATFSLKEVNRHEDEQPWLMADSPPSVSVFAQALAHAAREADFDRYHRAVFEAMQGEHKKLGEEELLALAAEAGVDPDRFTAERGRWVASVGGEHREAVGRWGVYGTPTLILDGAAAYLRLNERPASSDEGGALLDSLNGLATSQADLVELFRPAGEKPTPVTIELGRREGD
jgi:2-hydroxychromene-2-carboxylate isomerase